MIRRLPLIPTIVVAAAVAVMIGLGIWQLQRARVEGGPARPICRRPRSCRRSAWPTVPLDDEQLPLFRHATGVCLRPVGKRAVAGENRAGEPGYVHIVDCATGAEGPGMSVEVGWSKNPNAQVELGRRAGQRDHRARPRRPDAAGRGERSAGAASRAPPPSLELDPQQPSVLRASNGSPSRLIALVIYGLALTQALKDGSRMQ